MYFITLLTGIEENREDRCIGYYNSFKKANDIVCNNTCDLWETIYNYAVIECIPEGLYPIRYREFWYKYNEKENIYTLIEKPEELEIFVNFALG